MFSRVIKRAWFSKKKNNNINDTKETVEMVSDNLGVLIADCRHKVCHQVQSIIGESEEQWAKFSDSVEEVLFMNVSDVFNKVSFSIPDSVKEVINEDAMLLFKQSSRFSGVVTSAENAVQSAVVSAFHYNEKQYI